MDFVGAKNYADLVTTSGLTQTDFMRSIRNNAYFVLLVVPLQTVLALWLALIVNGERLGGKGFFRTAYYCPSVTSSVAVAMVFLFVFSSSGVVNGLLAAVGISGPTWFADPRGVLHVVLGWFGATRTDHPTRSRATTSSACPCGSGRPGPASRCARSSPSSCGRPRAPSCSCSSRPSRTSRKRSRKRPRSTAPVAGSGSAFVTLPLLRPTLFLVLTLGLIGTWQVFDQIYIMSQGTPGKTTLTPAFLSYLTSFDNNEWGQGSAIAFILFLIIVLLTLLQRRALREKDVPERPGRLASLLTVRRNAGPSASSPGRPPWLNGFGSRRRRQGRSPGTHDRVSAATGG